MSNKNLVTSYQSVITTLPEGYEVVGKFGEWKIYKDGQYVATAQSKKAAHDRANRHAMGLNY